MKTMFILSFTKYFNRILRWSKFSSFFIHLLMTLFIRYFPSYFFSTFNKVFLFFRLIMDHVPKFYLSVNFLTLSLSLLIDSQPCYQIILLLNNSLHCLRLCFLSFLLMYRFLTFLKVSFSTYSSPHPKFFNICNAILVFEPVYFLTI